MTISIRAIEQAVRGLKPVVKPETDQVTTVPLHTSSTVTIQAFGATTLLLPIQLEAVLRLRRLSALVGTAGAPASFALSVYRLETPLKGAQPAALDLANGSRSAVHMLPDSFVPTVTTLPVVTSALINQDFVSDLVLDPAVGAFYFAIQTSVNTAIAAGAAGAGTGRQCPAFVARPDSAVGVFPRKLTISEYSGNVPLVIGRSLRGVFQFSI